MIVCPSRGSRRIRLSYMGALGADVGHRARLMQVEVDGRGVDAIAQGPAGLGVGIGGLELEGALGVGNRERVGQVRRPRPGPRRPRRGVSGRSCD